MAGTMSLVAATGRLQSSDASSLTRTAGLAAAIWKHLPPGALHGTSRRAAVAVTSVIKLDADAFFAQWCQARLYRQVAHDSADQHFSGLARLHSWLASLPTILKKWWRASEPATQSSMRSHRLADGDRD